MKRIQPSEKDRAALQMLTTARDVTEREQPKDYKNCVVRKPWGYEYLIFENELVAIWRLRINGKHSTSMHCHPLKKTALILLSGDALCNTFYQRTYLSALDGLIIDQAVFHSTKALSPDGIELIEVETPPNKTDLVRLNDAYGREQNGYEGFSEMETDDLRRFDHFYFEEPAARAAQCHFGEHHALSIETFSDNDHFRDAFRCDANAIYCLCRGHIADARDRRLCDVGGAVSGSLLRAAPSLKIDDRIVLLTAKKKEGTEANHENHAG